MAQFVAQTLKIRCETCIGWGKVVRFIYGEEEKQTCPDCDGLGWNEVRLLVLVERKEKAPRPKHKHRPKKGNRSWTNLPGVPEGF